jgi:predicted esterase
VTRSGTLALATGTDEEQIEAAGTTCLFSGPPRPHRVVLMLHGYAMTPQDLHPFGRSLDLSSRFYFPRAPLQAPRQGYAWWPIDEERRALELQRGARDLVDEYPASRESARTGLMRLIDWIGERHPGIPLVLCGFSQGGMLACDCALHQRPNIAGLALLSSSRIAGREWAARMHGLRGLPVLVSHGTQDPDLAYGAGLELRDWLASAGAQVNWVSFEGGHEIPLPVWRALRRFLAQFPAQRIQGTVTA